MAVVAPPVMKISEIGRQLLLVGKPVALPVPGDLMHVLYTDLKTQTVDKQLLELVQQTKKSSSLATT